METVHYVYEWIRCDLNLPYYIGKGTGDRAYNPKRNVHTDTVTEYLIKNGIRREVRILAEFSTHEAAIEFEKERITFWWYLVDHKILTNKTLGGDGAASGDLNPQKRPEARLRVSKQMSGENNPSKRPENREKISKRFKGILRPELSGEKNGMYGKKCMLINHTEETKEKIREIKKQQWQNKSEQEKIQFANSRSKIASNWWEKLSNQDKKEFLDARKKSQKKRWENASEEDRKKHSEAVSIGLLTSWKNLSLERKQERIEANRQAQIIKWKNKTEEEKQKNSESHKKASKKMWDEITEENKKLRSQRIKEGKNKRTKEEKTAIALKAWETRRNKKSEDK